MGSMTPCSGCSIVPGNVGIGVGLHEGLQASLEKLRREAAEAALIRDLTTDKTKRDMFDRLHKHFNRLADEVKRAMRRRAFHSTFKQAVRAARLS
jgi:hypothetical protein